MHASSKMRTGISIRNRSIFFVVAFAICFVYVRPPRYLISSATWTKEDSERIAVVFIPGNAGSQLEARWTDRSDVAGPGCPHSADWHHFWLDIWQFSTTCKMHNYFQIFLLFL